MATTYKIVRYYQRQNSPGSRVIRRGLTLAEAQAHCLSRESDSTTAKRRSAKRTTERFGPWFDGYNRE